MKIMIKLIVSSSVVTLIFIVCGCAPQFKLVSKPDDMGLVCFYRPKKYFHGGMDFIVKANSFNAGMLPNGGYLFYYAKKGRIRFSARSEITSHVTLDIQPGEIYFIKGSVHAGQLVGRPYLQLVSPQVGSEEMATYIQKGARKNREASTNHGFDKGQEG